MNPHGTPHLHLPDPETAVRELEAAIGYPLPDDYRSFLKSTNGCHFEREEGHSPKEHYFPFQVAHLFPVLSPHPQVVGLAQERQSRAEVWPNYFFEHDERFVFGEDPCGNPFYLHLAGPHRGRVFTWVDGSNADEEAELASSFTEFLLGLRCEG